jgi:regulator of sirC expression with transglutaminase-like and TPR domain
MHIPFGLIALISPFLASPQKAQTLYNSLDPTSISEHIALSELYPDTPAGKKALQEGWHLLCKGSTLPPKNFSLPDLKNLIPLIQKKGSKTPTALSDSTLLLIKNLGSRLENRKLKGYGVKNHEELLSLDSEEIDVAGATLLNDPNRQSYEAMLDLMALQLLARLPEGATPEKKIEEMNRLVFDQMHFRFPPHSLYAKDIDHYTFLPSVLDSRQGVCLGVSILYLALAQRIGMPLEMVTPPGHIYVRFKNEKQTINIETTCRGVHIEDERYLGVDTCKLHERSKKQVIGLVSINEASVYLQQENFEKALECYQKALPFLPNDKLTLELYGFCQILTGKEEEGRKTLREALMIQELYNISEETLAEDILSNNADRQCLVALFKGVDEKRESVLKKKETLETILQSHPKFRDGWFAYASCWLQLHRQKEALETLEKYHALHPNDAKAEYYLAALYTMRLNYPKGWQHLEAAEAICQKKEHYPKALKELRKSLEHLCPSLSLMNNTLPANLDFEFGEQLCQSTPAQETRGKHLFLRDKKF